MAESRVTEPPVTPAQGSEPRVLIVAEHASARFGGEAILPLHYFRRLRKRGVEAWLVVHGRTRTELAALLGDELERVHFIDDAPIHRALWAVGSRMPARVDNLTTGYVSRLVTQRAAWRLSRTLVAQHRIDVVHQPIPVSPREPSLLWDVGAPVLIGPMNGGMSYPPAFRAQEGRVARAAIATGRWAAGALNTVLPGKRRAALLLVANARTRAALPPGLGVEVRELVENGVDRELFRSDGAAPSAPGAFLFLGRLVDWKALDLVLEALAGCDPSCTLDVLGDGPMRAAWEARANELGLANRVRFHGWVAQAEAAERLRAAAALVLPSLFECGGAVVLEAMATGCPVVATAWGGPLDYVNEQSGVLVEPSSRAALVDGFRAALSRLASEPTWRAQLSAAARERAAHFDWERKLDVVLAIYRELAAR